MALLYAEGFDGGFWQASPGTAGNIALTLATPNVLYGRFGGKGVRLGDSAPNATATVDSGAIDLGASDTMIMGFAFQARSWGPASSNTIAFNLFGTNNPFYGQNGSPGVVRQTVNGTAYALGEILSLNQWYYIEIKVTYHASTGSVQFRLDGSVTATYTDRNTGTKPTAWSPRWGGGGSADFDDFYLDDWYVCNTAGSVNNDYLGDVRVLALDATGNGNSSVLVGSDADSIDNYLLVDEGPINTSDYVGSGTEGDKDTYVMSDIDTGSIVLGVITQATISRTDTGTKYMRHVVRTNSTDYAGASNLGPADPSWAPTTEVWETNPNTTFAWTASEVNALEVGVEVRDS